MASRFSVLLVLSLVLLLSLSVNARLCKTLIISTYSISLLPLNPNPTNPNPNPKFISFIFIHHRFFLTRPIQSQEESLFYNQRPQLEGQFSSVRDPTKDILSVVASLLFGAACGALTAGTMYLVWAIFHYFYQEEDYPSFDDDESEEEEEDVFNPKKNNYNGYVPIPSEADTVPAKDSV